MSQLYITGDTHGEMSMMRLGKKTFPQGEALTRDDCIIITGDFGLVWPEVESSPERWWRNWLREKPFTVLFVDGNHENHDMLQRLPREEKFGGIVGVVDENIFHLRRGEIYEIGEKKILTFGGAESYDKERRCEGISWWKDEVPSYADMDNCLDNLERHDHKVDYIIAHTCPNFQSKILQAKMSSRDIQDPTCRMLEHIYTSCEFSDFYCGHWHIDEDYGKIHFLYERILKLI